MDIERRYPPKAILGTASEFATGQRLAFGEHRNLGLAAIPHLAAA